MTSSSHSMGDAELPLDEWLSRRAGDGHRALLVLAGDRDHAIRVVSDLFSSLGERATVAVSDHRDAPVPVLRSPKPAQLVGLELDAAFFDAFSGFDADVFGALSGTVRGGGLMVLACPPLDRWSEFADPFTERFAPYPLDPADMTSEYLGRLGRMLLGSKAALVRDPETVGFVRLNPRRLTADRPRNLNAEQQKAIDAVCHVVNGQRRRPVLLTADRGRGKSAALGQAAARLLAGGARRVIVTAIRRSALDVFFRHALEYLDGAGTIETRAGLIEALGGRIEFVEPRRLLEVRLDADLVVVDEAAALPVHWLERLVQTYSRLAFATTFHGYEGSGRGFAVRFKALLDQSTRGWREIHLDHPVRWARGDPVEALVFDTLLMNAEPPRIPGTLVVSSANCAVEILDRGRISRDESLLRDYFGLLVQSHYRTRPNDLRYLLDGPNIELWALRHDGLLLGAAVVSLEGGFDPSTAERIWRGETRPRGHMLAETVCAQLGEAAWPELRGVRVMRIAVHADARRMGFGRALVSEIVGSAAARGLDYVGCSFSAGVEAASFWSSSGFVPLWLSGRRNATSGARSIVMVKAISERAGALSRRARARFLSGFGVRLSGPYQDEAAGYVALMFESREAAEPPSARDLQDVRRFCSRQGTFEACFTGMWNVAQWILSRPDIADACGERGREMVVSAVLQQRDVSLMADKTGDCGRKGVLNELRLVFRRVLPLLERYSA